MATYSQLYGTPIPDSRDMGPVLLTLTSVLVSFTIITTSLRFWARAKRGRQGWDDYTIAICCLLAIGRTIIQIVSVRSGNGKHKGALTPAQYEYVNFLTWMTQLFLFVNICLLKCSICILILRIKDTKVLRWSLYTMMVGLVLTNGACVVVLLSECSPVQKYWAPATPGKCWNTKVRIYTIYLQVAYSVITDLICALLPIAVLWNVQIARSLKFAVCGLMSLGLIATACGIVRASSLGTTVTDLSFDYCIAAIWGNTELHLGIIATNLSLSRSIYGYFAGHIRALTSGSEKSTGLNSRGYMNSYLSKSTRKNNSRNELESTSSQIELGEQGIKKDMEFHIEEESIDTKNSSTRETYVTQKAWNNSPEAESGFPRHGLNKNSRDEFGNHAS